MILEPECIGCLFNQIYKSFLLLKPDISRDIILNTQIKLMNFLIQNDINNLPGPLIGQKTYNLISEALGNNDPYKFLKQKYNIIALEYYERAKDLVEKSEDPIFEAIAISAIGNTIDFGTDHEIDLINDIKNFEPENFKINDILKFKESLEKASQMLILLDNAGEIVFDKLLVETIKEHFPKLNITCSVREGPIINDATIKDAEYIGLTRIVKVIEAPAAPGIVISLVSEEFKELLFSKDVIILSKGQANFESLYLIDLPNKEVFYLLKAKCILMERIFNVNMGDLIFKKK